MSLQLSERLGATVPQVSHQPPDVHSLAAAEEAIELANAYGVCDGHPLCESQEITLKAALGERSDGSWAATRVADFGPRQGTGKSDKIAARELAGLLLFGEQLLIHTAHEFPTANECFLRLVGVFEAWDDLRRKVARIRYANGEQGIELLSGQRLKYRARTGGSGRGFAKADLLVYDEAQHLGREHLAASGPSKLANPNSQTWYAGSGGLSSSSVAWGIRRAALGGDGGRLAYTEMTAERVSLVGGRVKSARPNPADRDAWYRAMPGLGRWVTEESMEALYDELGPELFARECLCVWDAEAGVVGEGVFPQATWDLVNDPDVAAGGVVTFGVEVNPERSAAAIVAAGWWTDPKTDTQFPGLEVVEHRPGTGWLVERAKAINEKWGGPAWGYDGSKRAPISSFVPDLTAAGLNLSPVNTDMPAACGAIYDGIVDRKVRFRRHPSMDASVRGGSKTTGDAWVWDRQSGVDMSPLVAATAALWVSGAVSEADFFTV